MGGFSILRVHAPPVERCFIRPVVFSAVGAAVCGVGLAAFEFERCGVAMLWASQDGGYQRSSNNESLEKHRELIW
jgi:hypothetical protein